MRIEIILLNSMFLMGIGIVIGILGMTLILNKKVDRLNNEISRINNSLDNMNWNNSDNFYENNETFSNVKKTKEYSNTVNFMSYRNETDMQIAATNEDSLSQQRIKTNHTVGIVFCRNCASQFTSDKEECPVCGAKRH